MWSMLGARPVTMLAWESFGEGWVTDVVKQLKLDADIRTADYGEIPDLAASIRRATSSSPGTARPAACGCPTPTGSPTTATGLSICDATSAAFAQDIDWAKIDVGTFSWQKVLGGEAAHGMLVLGPRAVERLESEPAPRPLPKIFRLTKGGKLIDGVFKGETINTPSMLAVEDWLLRARMGGADRRPRGADRARRRQCRGARPAGCERADWIGHLAADPAIRSNTRVCLQFADRSDVEANTARQKAIVQLLDSEGRRLRHRRLSRRAAGPAHLVRRDGRHRRHRGARAVARLGLGGRPNVIRSGSKYECPKSSSPTRWTRKPPTIFRERGDRRSTRSPASRPTNSRRSSATMTGSPSAARPRSRADLLDAALPRLKVIGRAGIGVDTIDVPAATARGIVVMNTPFGNSITTAEHAIALMFALAREIPQADASTQAGKWEKNRFMGVELTGKTLGLIGCGNIGSIVADRALGLRMKVVAYDPFLTPERAVELGVEKVELDELLARADFITLHTPLTDQTRNILSREALAKTKPGVRIVNCARGGLIDEAALKDALDSGHVAGAALDVFVEEPAKDNPLFGTPRPGLHPASRRLDHRGAGQCRDPGRRADVATFCCSAASPTRSTCRRCRPRRRRG